MRKKRRIERNGLTGELPFDLVSGCAKVTLYGRKAAMIEEHCGVSAMDDMRIRFDGISGAVSIFGRGLLLKELSLDTAIVTGERLDSVAYDEGIRSGGTAHGDDD